MAASGSSVARTSRSSSSVNSTSVTDERITLLNGEFDTQVTIDEVTRRPIGDDFADPAAFAQRTGQCPLFRLRVRAPIRRVGNEAGRIDIGVIDDPGTPLGWRGAARHRPTGLSEEVARRQWTKCSWRPRVARS